MILVEAFKLKMIGKTEESNLCVRQSSIIRYILALGSVDLSKAIDALTNVKRQTSNYFYSDVARMCEIVTERIGAIKARAKHQKEMILEYADSIRRPDGTYPPPKREGIDDNVSEEERERAFAKIPSDVQRALITRDTQKINEYLASLSFEEGKSVLDEWSAAGLITIAIDSLEHGGKSQKKADPADNPQ